MVRWRSLGFLFIEGIVKKQRSTSSPVKNYRNLVHFNEAHDFTEKWRDPNFHNITNHRKNIKISLAWYFPPPTFRFSFSTLIELLSFGFLFQFSNKGNKTKWMKLKIIGARLRNNLGVAWASGATPFKQFPWIYSPPDPQRLAVWCCYFFLTSDALKKRAAGLDHACRDSPETGAKGPEKWCFQSEGPDCL